jgi:hypothetical protein
MSFEILQVEARFYEMIIISLLYVYVYVNKLECMSFEILHGGKSFMR